MAKLRQVDVLTSQGKSVADAIRTIGVTEVTYYRSRQEYGGLRSDQRDELLDGEMIYSLAEARIVTAGTPMAITTY